MGQRFQPRDDFRTAPVRLELGWKPAFRIAWAIVIVQFIVAIVGFVLFWVVVSLVLDGASNFFQ